MPRIESGGKAKSQSAMILSRVQRACAGVDNAPVATQNRAAAANLCFMWILLTVVRRGAETEFNTSRS
jgi:hypothetical protein